LSRKIREALRVKKKKTGRGRKAPQLMLRFIIHEAFVKAKPWEYTETGDGSKNRSGVENNEKEYFPAKAKERTERALRQLRAKASSPSCRPFVQIL